MKLEKIQLLNQVFGKRGLHLQKIIYDTEFV
jgi:hypothetical protein